MRLWWAVLSCLALAAAYSDEQELEVVLEFVEFDMEDACVAISEAEWAFHNGTHHNLTKLAEAHKDFAQHLRKEIDLMKMTQKKIFPDGKEPSSNKLKRVLKIFMHPGAPLLAEEEFQEAIAYATKVEELNVQTTVAAGEGMSLSKRQVDKVLRTERDEKKLRTIWSEWFGSLEKMPDADWLHHLNLLDLEAEMNGHDELSDYWLQQSEVTWANYEEAEQLWSDLIPLYQKLRQYIANFLVSSYGKGVIIDQKLIPVHLLGSLDSTDWITAAEKLGALDQSESYKRIRQQLSSATHEQLYKMADNFTTQMQMSALPDKFFNQSRFAVTGEACVPYVTDFCKKEYDMKAMACASDPVTLTEFVRTHKDVMRAKHLMEAGREDMENGHLTREGPRDSVLYEAMSGLAAMLALSPTNLQRQGLLPAGQPSDESITSLLLTALHIIPAMPYHLVSDLWRIRSLRELDALTTTETETTVTDATTVVAQEPKEEESEEEDDLVKRSISEEHPESNEDEHEQVEKSEEEKVDTVLATSENVTAETVTTTTIHAPPKVYNEHNVTMDWWKERATLQGVGVPGSGRPKDFLQDSSIRWSKPHISKFLGVILQFQILEYFRTCNCSNNTQVLQSLLRKGKSAPWEEIVASTLNITSFSTRPLLKYFEPLEAFLDGGAAFRTQKPLFTETDFKLFSQTSMLNATGHGVRDTAAAEGSDTVLYVLAAVAGIGTLAMVVTIARRRHQRRQRAKRISRQRALGTY